MIRGFGGTLRDAPSICRSGAVHTLQQGASASQYEPGLVVPLLRSGSSKPRAVEYIFRANQ